MNQDIFNYIERHIDPHPDNLHRLERATNIHLINGRMCSGHLQGRLLKMLTAMIRPKRVLELGTFSGYSAPKVSSLMPISTQSNSTTNSKTSSARPSPIPPTVEEYHSISPTL